MPFILGLLTIILSYLLGSVPFGLLVVKLATGKDIRHIESGRTGGTNAMRAAGFFAGAATAVLDFLKGFCAVWLARWLVPDDVSWRVWIEVLAPLCAILGHNYSIFLAERTAEGKLRLRGGAGGAPAVGGAAGLWLFSAFIIVPTMMLILFGIGYASVATMSVGVMSILIFTIRYFYGDYPWEYIMYGVAAEALLVIALQQNIKRLMNGTERLVGWRAKRKKTP